MIRVSISARRLRIDTPVFAFDVNLIRSQTLNDQRTINATWQKQR